MGKEGRRLSHLLILFSLFFGAWLWGIPGMILAVPALTAARIVFENVPALRPVGSLMDR
jgi:predicted PurR-regulated permease PerM